MSPSVVAPSSTPSPSPTKTCKPVPVRIEYNWDWDLTGTNIAEGEQAVIRHGVSLARAYFTIPATSCDPLTVGVYAHTRFQPTAGEFGAFAEGSEDIQIYAVNDTWAQASETGQLITLLHEWYHIYAAYYWSTPREQYWDSPPLWLIEGAAVVNSYRAAEHYGLASLASVYTEMRYTARSVTQMLKRFEKDRLPNGGEYSLGTLATQLLIERQGGVHALTVFWKSVGQGLRWQKAFLKAFGEQVAKFYAEFAAWRARGFS